MVITAIAAHEINADPSRGFVRSRAMGNARDYPVVKSRLRSIDGVSVELPESVEHSDGR